MPRGSATLFNETLLAMGRGEMLLHSDTLKMVIVDDTITPTAADATPTYSDYSANEVSAAGNYITGGITMTTVTYTLISDIATLKADDVNILEHASGFLDGYWGIIIDTTASGSPAIGFIEMLGPVSEQAGDVDFEFPAGVVADFPANVAA